MKKLPPTYVKNLAKALEHKVAHYDPETKVLMFSGAAMNWIGDFISDRNVRWAKKKLNLNALYLTGTNPAWNRIIIDKCGRSPEKLREFFHAKKNNAAVFRDAKYSSIPIMVRVDEGQYKVLDGMNRVIAAIRMNRKKINAYIASSAGKPRPVCENHVVYDLIKAHQRGINRDKKGLIAALRFLRKSYINVDSILRRRLDRRWLPDMELQKIIKEALK